MKAAVNEFTMQQFSTLPLDVRAEAENILSTLLVDKHISPKVAIQSAINRAREQAMRRSLRMAQS
jgi:hypothetical protein